MRNQMHNFALQPEANIPRSRFDLSQNVKFTGNTGRLIPFYVQEVLPGDTFDVNTSVVCRLQTLIHPLMDNLYLDTYYFFVPNRLVWDNWKHFCGEPNKAWVADREWTVPKITIGCEISRYEGETDQDKYNNFLSESFKDSIVDYMQVGLNSNVPPLGLAFSLNAMPIRAYNKIYDDWFRDENLMDPVNLYTGDNAQSMVYPNQWENPLIGGRPYLACKLHDYFTSALPQAQRGNPVSLSTGNIGMPVITGPVHDLIGTEPAKAILKSSNFPDGINTRLYGSISPDATSGNVSVYTTVDSSLGLYFNNLYAGGSGIDLGITINDLRMAFAVQRWMEKSARGGARYIEIIKTMFGVESPDARLQRSEYLGGHRVPINIHQIVNTTETIDTPLGNTGAMSVTSDVHNDFIHSFVEHGHVIGICVVRYKHSYPQGFDKMWSRSTIFDYYWPSFAFIGEQPIWNYEIYGAGGKQVFGYNEAWSEYRYKPNRVMGEMRPGVPNSLSSWHLADFYESQPVLGSSWIKEDIAPVDRAIAVQSSAADQFLFDIMIQNKATRPMPLYSIPGLIDHF